MRDPHHDSTWSVGDILSRPHRLDLIWLLLPVALTCIGFGLLPLRNWDYWWHLAMGRMIDAWGAVPAANHFLYTVPADAPSFDQPWLAQLFLFGLHTIGDLHAGLLARNLLATAGVAAIGYTAMRRSGSVVLGSLLTLGALPFLFDAVTLGPVLFAWPLFGAVVWLACDVDRGDRSPYWLLAIPALGALWANLHPSFLLAALFPALVGLGSLLRRRRAREHDGSPPPTAWFSAALGTATAALANPRGSEIFAFSLRRSTERLVGSHSTHAIWQTVAPSDPLQIWTLLVLAIGGGILWWRRRHLDPLHPLLFGTLGALALLHSPARLWWGSLAPVLLAPSLSGVARTDSEYGERHPLMRRLHTAGALLLVVSAVAVQPTWQWRVDWLAGSDRFDVRTRPPLKGVVSSDTPLEAAEILHRYADPPRLFHDHRYAGFLLYQTTDARPRRKFFVDRRRELPDRTVWNEYHLLLREPSEWRRIFERYDIGAAVLSRRRASGLIDALRSAEGWTSIYSGSAHVLLMASDSNDRGGENEGG